MVHVVAVAMLLTLRATDLHFVIVLPWPAVPKVRVLASQTLACLLFDSPLAKWSGGSIVRTAAPGAAGPSSASASRVVAKQGAFTSLSARYADMVCGLFD